MVEDIQPNANVSLDDHENEIVNAMAGLADSGMVPSSPGSEGSKFTKDYPGLTTAVAMVTKMKWMSVFTDLVNDSKKIKDNTVKNITQRVNVMPKPGYTEIKAAAKDAQKKASLSLKGGSKFLGKTFAEQIKLARMSVGKGPGVFKIKGMQATVNMVPKIMAKLKKQLEHVRMLKRTPYLNSNGTLNTEKFTKDLGRGVNAAEEFYNKRMNHNAIKPHIYTGMGGPPTTAS